MLGSKGGVALAEKFSYSTPPIITLLIERDASACCHPALFSPFVRTLTDIFRCLTKCFVGRFGNPKFIRFFSE